MDVQDDLNHDRVRVYHFVGLFCHKEAKKYLIP